MMQNTYSNIEEFICDAAMCGFSSTQLINDEIYTIADDESVVRQITSYIDGKPV